MAHPETLLPMTTIDDPTERFISVVKFYLSGWHIKPPYVAVPCSLFPAPRFPAFFFFFFGGGSAPMDTRGLTIR